MTVLDFTLPAELEAHEPPEARGVARDGVRLLASRNATGGITHHRFTDLPELLRPGDVLVVNTSGTLPAAVPVLDSHLTVHFSTAWHGETAGREGDPVAGNRWLVELRQAQGKATAPYPGGEPGDLLALPGGADLTLRERFSRRRLWLADVAIPTDPGVLAYLARLGRPIRYSYVRRDWPIDAYQTVFATEPGSAEMPSAARPFTDRVVTRLVAAGVLVVPVLLHTGVASPEAHERPYPEWFRVPAATARAVNAARAGGGRVIAVGTTAVRALESAARADGTVGAASGRTELIVTPERGVRVVDGLLTGLHEPRASHLDMLAAIADRDVLGRAYQAALAAGYRWHEFGDVHLILP